MEITITGRHMDMTDAIKDYATEKVGKLTRYYDRLQAVEVVTAKSENNSYEVEMIAHVKGHEHFVAGNKGYDLYACIDETADKLGRQLTDYKDKLKNPKHSA